MKRIFPARITALAAVLLFLGKMGAQPAFAEESPDFQVTDGINQHDSSLIQRGIERGAKLIGSEFYRFEHNTELNGGEPNALDYAISAGNLEAVKLLAEHGLSVRSVNAQLAAGLSGSLEQLAALERMGMPLETRTSWTEPYMKPAKYFFPTCSPLLLAAVRNSRVELVQSLLKRKLNPNARCLFLTPLLEVGELKLFTRDLAKTANADATVRLLIAFGADPNARGEKEGETLLERIPEWASPELVKFLFQHGAKLTYNSELLQQNIFNDVILDLEMLKVFVEVGHADTKQKTSSGENLLVNSICRDMDYPSKRFAIWEYLISKGAALNEENKEGKAILRLAIEWGFTPSAIKRLRELGAR